MLIPKLLVGVHGKANDEPLPVAFIVTAPVAPDIVTFVPATIEVTPVLVNAEGLVPEQEMPDEQEFEITPVFASESAVPPRDTAPPPERPVPVFTVTDEFVRPALFNVPLHKGVIVKVDPTLVIASATVRPLNDAVEVANPITGPVDVARPSPTDVKAALRGVKPRAVVTCPDVNAAEDNTPPEVVCTNPATVRFERVVIFCVVFTLHVPGAVPLQVVPVPLPNEVTPEFVIVTAPVAPETEIPVPATLEVTPVLVIVSPEPITDCPAVTLMPVPFEMVPVAEDWNIPPEPTYRLPCATPLFEVVLKRLEITLPVTAIGKVPVYVVGAVPFEMAVISPLPFTVTDGYVKVPTFEFTVARVAATEFGPVAVTSPVKAVM